METVTFTIFPKDFSEIESIKNYFTAKQIQFELVFENTIESMNHKDFEQWIKKAEASENLYIEEFQQKWQKKKQQLIG